MYEIPKAVNEALAHLKKANHESYIVGGCVRDLVIGRLPKDWDITTNAKPEQILALFSSAGYKAFYENDFGTVTAIIGELPIEITPFRKEGKYSDKRRPDEITWAKTLEEDLARRDFTINAMALSSGDSAVIDIFGGKEDIKKKLVRAVGVAGERFSEDALRLLRACRIAIELGFKIEENTRNAILLNVLHIQAIAGERIRDEVSRIILAQNPEQGILLLKDVGLLKYIFPELLEGEGVTQRGPHRFDIFRHNLFSLKWAATESGSLVVRLAALFHDIGKVKTRQVLEDGKITFYDHPKAGAHIASAILTRLHFPHKIIEDVAHLVYHHMFYYDVGKVTPSGVRRLLLRVGGKEIFDDLLIVRRADRRATPVPKTHPYRLRHLEYMVEKVATDPLSRFQLMINGDDIKNEVHVPESPRIGLLINALLAEVLENPQKNTREQLLSRVKELTLQKDEELKEKAHIIFEKTQEREQLLKSRHYIK